MDFISTMRRQKYTLRPAGRKVHETSGGSVVTFQRSKRVEFTPMNAPMFTPLLAAKDGKAWGSLDTATEAKRLGIEEETLNEFLMQHPDYGVRMVAVGNDGQEVVSDDVYVLPEGEKGFYCKLCQKHLKTLQAKQSHVKSLAHEDALAIAKEEYLSQIGG